MCEQEIICKCVSKKLHSGLGGTIFEQHYLCIFGGHYLEVQQITLQLERMQLYNIIYVPVNEWKNCAFPFTATLVFLTFQISVFSRPPAT